MKKLLPVLCFSLISGAAQAQTVLENDPSKAYSKFIAPAVFVDMASDENLGISLALGADARYAFTPIFDLEGKLYFNVFGVSDRTAFHAEVGGFYPLGSKEKLKDLKVIVGNELYAGTDDYGRDVEEITYVGVSNGKFLNKYGVRAGLYSHTAGLEFENPETFDEEFFTYNLTGIYAGLQFTSQAYVKIDQPGFGKRVGAGFTRYYADVFVLPINSFDIAGLEKESGLGGRIGMQWYVSPHDGSYHYLGRSVFSAEVGTRPYTSFYLTLGWGYALGSKR